MQPQRDPEDPAYPISFTRPAAHELEELEALFEDLHVSHELGHDAVSTVFRGKLREHDVVVKKLTSADCKLVYSRDHVVYVEAKLRDLKSEFIAPVLNLGDRHLIQKYAPGWDLHDEILTLGHVDEERVARIAHQISEALAEMHEEGIFHRDITRRSIRCSREAAQLVDLGLCEPGPDLHPGPRRFMAPELLRGQTATPATDMYALGVVLFEAATGEEFSEELFERSPQQKLKGDLGDLIQELLRRDPSARPAAKQIVARSAASVVTVDADASPSVPEAVRTLTFLLAEPYRLSIEAKLRAIGADALREELDGALRALLLEEQETNPADALHLSATDVAAALSVEADEGIVIAEARASAESFIAFWLDSLDEALEEGDERMLAGDLLPTLDDRDWQEARADMYAQLRISEVEMQEVLHDLVAQLTLRGDWAPVDEPFTIHAETGGFVARHRE